MDGEARGLKRWPLARLLKSRASGCRIGLVYASDLTLMVLRQVDLSFVMLGSAKDLCCFFVGAEICERSKDRRSGRHSSTTTRNRKEEEV